MEQLSSESEGQAHRARDRTEDLPKIRPACMPREIHLRKKQRNGRWGPETDEPAWPQPGDHLRSSRCDTYFHSSVKTFHVTRSLVLDFSFNVFQSKDLYYVWESDDELIYRKNDRKEGIRGVLVYDRRHPNAIECIKIGNSNSPINYRCLL